VRKMTTTVKVSARIPRGLAERMDRLIEEGLYSNRSEIIKEALRYFLLNEQHRKLGPYENNTPKPVNQIGGNSVVQRARIRRPARTEESSLQEPIPKEFCKALDDPRQVAEMVWYGVLGWAERHGVKGNPLKMASELLKAERRAAGGLPDGHLRTELIRDVLTRAGTKFALRGVREAIHDLPWLKQAFYSKFPHRCLWQAIEEACICEEWGDIWYEPERRNCDGKKHSVFVGLLYASILQLIEKMGGDTYAVPEIGKKLARLSVEGVMRECSGALGNNQAEEDS